MASIRLEGVWKRYGPLEAVKALGLACADGELLALLGPSGCGKTSTLKMIAGIEEVTEGEIYFGGRDVTALEPAARNVAMVFEDYALYPHLTVAGNVAFPLEIQRRARKDIHRAVDEVLALLGLAEVRDVGVRHLSGGAQQRVAIGRALVRQPELILFDEPLSHLDSDHKVQLRAEIKRLQKQTGVTGVLVTHDQTEAMAMADRVAVMDQGVLQQLASPQALYEHPANMFVAQFIGEPPMNLLPGQLQADNGASAIAVTGDGWRIRLPSSVAARLTGLARGAGTVAGGEVMLGVRPEHMSIRPFDGGEAAPGLVGRVFFREPRGDVDVVLVKVDRPIVAGNGALGREVITVEVPAGVDSPEGVRVAVTLSADRVHLFDARSGRNVNPAENAT